MRKLLLAVIVCLAAGCAARMSSPSASAARNGVSETSVRAHMEFLAADALNGRGSGTRDEWIAATYIASHLRRWGLEPLAGSFVQEVRVERSEVTTPAVLTFGSRRATHGKEIVVTSMAATRLAGPLQKYQAGTPVSPGAVLLLPETNPPGAGETAAAAIVLSLETEQIQKRRLGMAATPGPQQRLQWIVGTPKRAGVALDKDTYAAVGALAAGTQISLEAEAKPAQTAQTWNAVGRLPGRASAGQTIVLSAHHDHIGSRPTAADPGGPKPAASTDVINNGADDDASGVIAVMEIAEAMSRGPRPARTVIFAFFGSEETGGLGSSHFIDASGVPLETVVANLQFEMIGRPDGKVPPQTLWLTGYERSNLGEELARRGARLVADPHPEQSFFTRSDNIRFARRGVIAHTVSSYGLHTDYHRPSDEIDTIDFPHMTRAIQSMIEPIRWLANSNFKPQWKPGMRP